MELFDAIPDLALGEAKFPCGPGLHPAVASQRCLNLLSFQILQGTVPGVGGLIQVLRGDTCLQAGRGEPVHMYL